MHVPSTTLCISHGIVQNRLLLLDGGFGLVLAALSLDEAILQPGYTLSAAAIASQLHLIADHAFASAGMSPERMESALRTRGSCP